MQAPFSRHSKQWYAPRPSWGKQATINGRPAWQVAEERKARREALIKKLPQDMVEFAPEDLSKLEKFVEKHSTTAPPPNQMIRSCHPGILSHQSFTACTASLAFM